MLQGTLALFFLLAGVAALGDTPAPGADFELLTDLLGAGAWLRLTVGGLEVGGALLLVVPTLAGLGATVLGGTMAVAALAYLLVLHLPPVVPGVLLAGLAILAYAYRATLLPLGRFLERNL